MSISSDRPEAVRKYFTKTPAEPEEPDYSSKQTQMTIGGILLLITLFLLFSGKGFLILLGIIGGIVGFNLLREGFSKYSEMKEEYEKASAQYRRDYALSEPKPSDEQIDQWLDDDKKNIIAESLRKLDLDREDYKVEPFILGGPDDSQDTRYARGKDGKIRYSRFNILIVYLTDHNVSTYQSRNDLVYGQTLSDTTREFPYKEITNLELETINKNISLVDGKRDFVSGVHQFALYTSGGNIIKVIYSFAKSADQNNEIIRIGTEDTIKAIRKKLEEYKKIYGKSVL